MIRTHTLGADVLSALRHHRRQLLVFHLFFTGLAIAILIPASTWPLVALRHVTGRSALSTGGILEFLMSPAGLLWAFTATTLTALLAVLQQAGMVLVPAMGAGGRYRNATAALWTVAHRFPRLLGMTITKVLMHMLVASPFVLAVNLAYEFLIVPYEGYYIRVEWPPALWAFIGISAVAAAGIIACNGWLYLRWILSIPLIMLENLGVRRALQRSSELTRGQRLHIAGAVLGAAAVILILPVLFSMLFDAAGGRALALLPERMSVVGPAVLTYLSLYVTLTIALAFLTIAINSLLLYVLYLRATGVNPRISPPPAPRRASPLAWSAEVVLIVFAVVQAIYVVQSFDHRETVTITAHRGSSVKAPENTLSAIEQAIEDGADYVEIDVRQTADGTLVLWHDADLRRMAGIRRPIWELTYERLREVDIGSRFSPEFAGERIATLEEAIEAVRGRAGLYVEIKPSPATPDLTRNVVAMLQEKNFVDDAVLASLKLAVVREARQLEPRLSTTLFAELVIGALDRTEFSALGLRHNRVTPRQVAIAHRHGHALHVWTVNRRRAMSRFIDMGVDNIITDRPDVLAELLEERARLTDTERLLTKLRNWLSH